MKRNELYWSSFMLTNRLSRAEKQMLRILIKAVTLRSVEAFSAVTEEKSEKRENFLIASHVQQTNRWEISASLCVLLFMRSSASAQTHHEQYKRRRCLRTFFLAIAHL